MADIPDKQRQSVGLVSQIPFGAIIGGPLNAAVDAQSAAAVACYDFIKNVGFELETKKDAAGNDVTVPGKVRDITFRFEREVPAAQAGGQATTSKMSITVPLLTVMPLPFIRIESLTVSYKVHITAEDTHTDTTTTSFSASATAGGSVGWGLWKANFSASVSTKKDSTATNTSKYSVEQTMDVNVHAVQDDMPAGMAKILSIMTDAITVTRG
jgi:hypothetical protein